MVLKLLLILNLVRMTHGGFLEQDNFQEFEDSFVKVRDTLSQKTKYSKNKPEITWLGWVISKAHFKHYFKVYFRDGGTVRALTWSVVFVHWMIKNWERVKLWKVGSV